MTRDEFVSKLASIFDVTEESLQLETELDSLSAWDSLGLLSVIALTRQAGSAVHVNRIQDAETIDDLVNLLSDKLN